MEISQAKKGSMVCLSSANYFKVRNNESPSEEVEIFVRALQQMIVIGISIDQLTVSWFSTDEKISGRVKAEIPRKNLTMIKM